MTLDEFEKLNEYDKLAYSDSYEQGMETWREIEQFAQAPYPLNFINYCYAGYFVAPQGCEEIAQIVVQGFLETFSQTERDVIRCIFCDRLPLDEMQVKLNLTWFTIINQLAKAARKMRHPSRFNSLKRQICSGVLEI